MRKILVAVIGLVLSAAFPAQAQTGLTVSADLGGGGVTGPDSSGLFEGELIAGYEFPLGIRPELGVVLGLAPGTYFALRPGVHVPIPALPFYARGAIDWATAHGHDRVRWLLLGGGLELRLVDRFGVFGEADTGVPLSGGAGVPLEIRAGVTFRL